MLGTSQLPTDLDVHLVAFLGHLSAYVEQGVGSVVVHLPFVINYLIERLAYGGIPFHPRCQLVQHRIAHGVVAQQKAQALAYGVQRGLQVGHCLQLYHRPFHTQAVQLRSEVDKVLSGKTIFQHQYLPKLLGLLQFAHHMVVTVRKGHLLRHPHSQLVATLRSHKFPYAGESYFVFYGHHYNLSN